ncbi:MAG: IS200/IS605 family transposase, partial [Ardenticatenaceae bacterium]
TQPRRGLALSAQRLQPWASLGIAGHRWASLDGPGCRWASLGHRWTDLDVAGPGGSAMGFTGGYFMSYWRLFYHFVWGTKNREPVIDLEWETSLHNVIAAKAQKLGALVYAVGGVEDHVHLAASVPPTIALATFAGQLKGNSSHFINHQLSLPYDFKWQAQYGVVSFGGKQLDMVVRYIKEQREHHREHTIISFLELTNSSESSGSARRPVKPAEG